MDVPNYLTPELYDLGVNALGEQGITFTEPFVSLGRELSAGKITLEDMDRTLGVQRPFVDDIMVEIIKHGINRLCGMPPIPVWAELRGTFSTN